MLLGLSGLSKGLGLNLRCYQPYQQVQFFHSSIVASISKRTIRKAAAKERKIKNLSSRSESLSKKGRVDPVLGKRDNLFLQRIETEIFEPSSLGRSFTANEVDKLLVGAKEHRELKSSLVFGEQLGEEIKVQEEEKRSSILRILDLRNASNYDKNKLKKKLAIKEFERFEGDTGSSEVQAAVLTVKIHSLMEHVKSHPQDLVHIRKTRMLVQKRQRTLKYLKRDQPKRYFWAIEKLGLTDEAVTAEFNMDRRYLQEFNVWPGRTVLKISKKESEAAKKQKRATKVALRRALINKNNEANAN